MTTFYEITDPSSGRIILTGKSVSGKWAALKPDHTPITHGHKTRKEAVYHAVRILDREEQGVVQPTPAAFEVVGTYKE